MCGMEGKVTNIKYFKICNNKYPGSPSEHGCLDLNFNPLWERTAEFKITFQTRMINEYIFDIWYSLSRSVGDILIMKSVTAYLSHYIKWWQRFLSLQQIMWYNTYNYNYDVTIKNNITTLKGNIKWMRKFNELEPPPSYPSHQSVWKSDSLLLDKNEANLRIVHLAVHLPACFHFVNVIFQQNFSVINLLDVLRK